MDLTHLAAGYVHGLWQTPTANSYFRKGMYSSWVGVPVPLRKTAPHLMGPATKNGAAQDTVGATVSAHAGRPDFPVEQRGE